MSAMNGIAFRPSTTLPHPLLPCFTVSVSGLSFFFAARRADRFIALPLVDKEIELKICEPAENKLLSREELLREEGSSAEKSCFVGSVSSLELLELGPESSWSSDQRAPGARTANCQLQNSSDNFPREGVKL